MCLSHAGGLEARIRGMLAGILGPVSTPVLGTAGCFRSDTLPLISVSVLEDF